MKAWKWARGLPRLGRAGEEQVHQHGLAPSRRPPEIDAPHLGQSAEQALLAQLRLEPRQDLDGRDLGRIGRQTTVGEALVISARDTAVKASAQA